MKRQLRLTVEQLESRDNPSNIGTGIILDPPGQEGGAPPTRHVRLDGSIDFVPPGVVAAIDNPNLVPPPMREPPGGLLAFLPPGLDRIYYDPNQTPPPVQIGLDVEFLPPGIFQDPNEAPDPGLGS